MSELGKKIVLLKKSWIEFWDFIKTCVTFEAFTFLFPVYLFFDYTIYKIVFSGSMIQFVCLSVFTLFSLFGFSLSLERAIEVGVRENRIFTGTPRDNFFFELLLFWTFFGIILFFLLRKTVSFIIWICAVFFMISVSLLSFIFNSGKKDFNK